MFAPGSCEVALLSSGRILRTRGFAEWNRPGGFEPAFVSLSDAQALGPFEIVFSAMAKFEIKQAEACSTGVGIFAAGQGCPTRLRA
jgi:hypothetical protein